MKGLNKLTTDKINTLIHLRNEIYEVEDDYLETWLMEGMPDGTTIGEIIDDYIDEIDEWITLAKKLLKEREENEDEEIF